MICQLQIIFFFCPFDILQYKFLSYREVLHVLSESSELSQLSELIELPEVFSSTEKCLLHQALRPGDPLIKLLELRFVSSSSETSRSSGTIQTSQSSISSHPAFPDVVWGVSIFHVYGHQWACQLWYHPRKDECWGLSDGEVCEQFWSGLCHLVPGLCIAGYHCRLFILDMQMEHIQKSKQSGLGEWLHSHLLNAKRHLVTADVMRALGQYQAAEWC